MSDPATQLTKPEETFAPLPRQTRQQFSAADQPPSRFRHDQLLTTTSAITARRLLAWIGVAVSFFGRNFAGRLVGRTGMKWRGKRLAQAMTLPGDTGRTMARILSIRHDLLPYPHCVELSQIKEEASPIALAEIKDRIVASVGSPIEEAFSAFDPEPIAFTTIDTTWQARLTDGRDVLVRVRRPGIIECFAGDVQATTFVLSFTDFLTVLPSWAAAGVRHDVREYLVGNLDFVAQARFHRVFKKWQKKDRLRTVSVAEVLSELSSPEVLVVERAQGVPLTVVVNAVLSGDQVGLARLRQQGIEPKRIARNLLELSWWEMFEGMFVHIPRVEDVVVRPGGSLVMQQLTGPGMSGTRTRRMYRLAMRHLARNDVGGAVDAFVQMLSPLPHIDVHTFSGTLERRVGRCLLALADSESPWPARTSAPVLVGVLETARSFGVPVRPDILRLVRTSVAFHELAGLVWPETDLLKEYVRYENRADRRASKRAQREVDRLERFGLESALIARLSEFAGQMERIGFFVDAVTANPPVRYFSLAGKVSYTASILLNVIVTLGALALFGTALTAAYGFAFGETSAFLDNISGVLWHPLFLLVATVIGFISVRRIHSRLTDHEEV
ncbi:MAG: hypothetical protein HN348_03365 [Proteobacteria bacterium]|nr:hypothetical protein [Pseudomonadota bacterium]